MIKLTKLNGSEFYLNCDLIETIQENPDTTIHLTTGPLYIVKESAQEVLRLAIEYHQKTLSNILYQGFTGEKPSNE